MNKQDILQLLEKFKKPLPLLLSVIFIGFLINLSIFLYKYLPTIQEQVSFNQQYNQVERQMKSVEAIPIPAKASPNDIESLVKQIPTKDEVSRFILNLKEIEAKTGVNLTTITFGEGKDTKKTDDLTAIINSQLKNNQANTNQTPNPNVATPPPAAPGKSGETFFQENHLTIVISGLYPQVIDFFNKVYQLERVVNVVDWNIEPISEPAVNPTDKKAADNQAKELKIQAKLGVVVYSAKQFLGKFPDLPAIPTDSFEPKATPMLSEEQYLQMLNSTNNAKK
jgi:Tfp pilus assembly protein PilO